MSISEQIQSEEVYKIVVEEASILAALYTGPEIRIKVVNAPMLRAWGKDESVIGKTIREANPELEGQPFFDYFDKVYATGTEFAGNEEPATLLINGEMRTSYYNFSYKPLKHADGSVWGIVHTAMDVTEQVRAKKSLERSEEMLRLAIDSAQMGAWYVDVPSMKLKATPRINELFGYHQNDNMTLDDAFNQISGDYRERVISAIDAAITKGENYDIEYPVIGFRDNTLRWVRATGKLYQTEGAQARLAGTLLDITGEKQLEQRKDDFISIASHELKTPITSLKASLQLLNRMKEDVTSDRFQNFIEKANKSVKKISVLIDDLLNVNRMNAGQVHLNKTSFRMAELIDSCCSHVREDGKHELILEGDSELIVFADEIRIDQVLVNLVNNAVKYAPAHSKIYLKIESDGKNAKVSVKDQGSGIAPEKLPFLFNRYYKADNEGNQYSGLGLGLYISSEIIKRHEGQIGVESEPGKGSTFWFTIPL